MKKEEEPHKAVSNSMLHRLLALALACVLFFNAAAPVYAQWAPLDKAQSDSVNATLLAQLTQARDSAQLDILPYPAAKILMMQELNEAQIPSADIPEEAFLALYNIYVEGAREEERQISAVAQKAAQDSKTYFNQAYTQWFDNTAKKLEDNVCVQDLCAPAHVHMRGVLRALLRQDNSGPQHLDDISWIINNFYAQPLDAKKAEALITAQAAKIGQYCRASVFRSDLLGASIAGGGVDNRQRAQESHAQSEKDCQAVSAALLTLGALAQTSAAKKAAAQTIFDAMAAAHKKAFGVSAVLHGTAALMALDTTESFAHLETFLLKTSVPAEQGLREFGRQALDLLNITAYAQKGISATNKLQGGDGAYLNNLSARYQYIGEEAIAATGLSPQALQVANNLPTVGFNIPQNNVLEDIGQAIAQSPNPRAQALAVKILAKFNAEHNVHTPLVAGVIKGGLNAGNAAAALHGGDWWDLNEATQRRINNLPKNLAPVAFSAAKKTRWEQNQHIIGAANVADSVVGAIFLGMFLRTLAVGALRISAMISNISRARAIGQAGRGALLQTVRANMRAQGITRAKIDVVRAGVVVGTRNTGLSAAAKSAPVAPLSVPAPKPTLAGLSRSISYKYKLAAATVPATFGLGGQSVTAQAADAIATLPRMAIVAQAPAKTSASLMFTLEQPAKAAATMAMRNLPQMSKVAPQMSKVAPQIARTYKPLPKISLPGALMAGLIAFPQIEGILRLGGGTLSPRAWAALRNISNTLVPAPQFAVKQDDLQPGTQQKKPGKTSTFFWNFAVGVSIASLTPAFQGAFGLDPAVTNTIMNILAYAPATAIWFFSSAFKKWGTLNVFRGASVMALVGTALTVLSGLNGFSAAASALALPGAIAGIGLLSLATEIRLASAFPLIGSNFDKSKVLSVSTNALLGRALGSAIMLNFMTGFNWLAGSLGFAAALNSGVALATVLLPMALFTALATIKTPMADAPAEEASNFPSLMRMLRDNSILRRAAIGFTLLEAFDATINNQFFNMAEVASQAGTIPGSFVGTAGSLIPLSMAVGRLIFGALQKHNIVGTKSTYAMSAALSAIGTAAFVAGGLNPLGIAGLCLAMIGISVFSSPLLGATSAQGKVSDADATVVLFGTSTLAAFSGFVQKQVMGLFGSSLVMGYAVPALVLVLGFFLTKFVFKDSAKASAIKAELDKEMANIDNAPTTPRP